MSKSLREYLERNCTLKYDPCKENKTLARWKSSRGGVFLFFSGSQSSRLSHMVFCCTAQGVDRNENPLGLFLGFLILCRLYSDLRSVDLINAIF